MRYASITNTSAEWLYSSIEGGLYGAREGAIVGKGWIQDITGNWAGGAGISGLIVLFLIYTSTTCVGSPLSPSFITFY